MNNIGLSVIVLSFNTKDITNECLTKLKKSVIFCEKKLGAKIEVIVVENASEDGSLEMIKKSHPWVKLIPSKINTGFSGGNNIGMKASKGEYILLLNSDAFVKEDTLFKSLEYFQIHPKCDLLGCQLRFANGKLQPSGGYLPTPLNTIFWISGLAILPLIGSYKPIHPRNPNFFNKDREVGWVMGAFFIFKREIFDKTCGFDESIFMYGEEVEWCKRIKDKGFRMFYTPSFSITHLDKASSKFMLEKPLLNEIKGIVRYFNTHYKNEYPLVKLFMRLSLMLRVAGFTLLGNSSRRRAYIDALSIL